MSVFVPVTASIANEGGQKVLIKVAGLYCPFCSYGLEKQVKKIDGVKAIKINIKKGTAEITYKPGAKVSEKAILVAVEDAGFDLDSVEWLSGNPK
jgi:copper chaperone CopZ